MHVTKYATRFTSEAICEVKAPTLSSFRCKLNQTWALFFIVS